MKGNYMDRETFFETYHLNLTAQQREAVCAVDRPVLLLAVPGSGKTTTLVSRAAYLTEVCGIPPERILTLTYTVAASRDMHRRFSQLFGEEKAGKVKFQTINALCQWIIYCYNRRNGSEGFRLLEDNHEVLREVYLQVQGEYPADGDLKNMQQILTWIKNSMLSPEAIEGLEYGDYRVKALYDTYVDTMKERRQMDFDDQLVYARRILRRYPEILKYCQDRFPYICLDEAQDTSAIQHDIVRLLASRDRHIFMVGDEDQSIYGFRAACPQALMEFEKNWPDGRVLFLEQNFRSTPQIVRLADAFIARNGKRREKHMVTERTEGKPVRCLLLNRKDQYQEIAAMVRDSGMTYSTVETAILYRNNDSAVPLIYRFLKEGIPYRSRGMDALFFTSPPVQFFKDVLQLAYHPGDCDAFLRIYWKLECYLKKEDALRAAALCRAGNVESPLDALMGIDSIPRWNREKLQELRANLALLCRQNAAAAISGFPQMFGYYDDKERYFLLSSLADRSETPEEFLQKLDRLQSVMESGSREPSARVTLSTIHSSKGLEYDRVILMDALDGILPSSGTGSGSGAGSGCFGSSGTVGAKSFLPADLEEERRLFYVGATRARQELVLVDYKGAECPFLRTFLQQEPKKKQVPVPNQGEKAPYQPLEYKRRRKQEETMLQDVRRPHADGAEEASSVGCFSVGCRVQHGKFGIGVVVSSDSAALIVDFEEAGEKKFLQASAGRFLKRVKN